MSRRSRISAGSADTDLTPLLQALGCSVDADLLERALTHRSYAYEHGGLPNNERLEFLGDAVLGLIVTDALFHAHPDLAEGQLAKLRSAVVNMRALAEVGRALDLGRHIRLGRGEETTGGRDKSSILADTVEAVLGAVYLSEGLQVATRVISSLFATLLSESATLGAGLDWKTSLQELTASLGVGVPEYVLTETGPDHEKSFTAGVLVAGVLRGKGCGRTKKEAEQQAASHAWSLLHEAYAASEQRVTEQSDEPHARTAGS